MLTTVRIRALKPVARPCKVPGGGGLYLLVQPSGSLLWRSRDKVFGTDRKLSPGCYPDVFLLQACLTPDEARSGIEEGVDPLQEKQQKRLEAELAAKTIFKLVADEFI